LHILSFLIKKRNFEKSGNILSMLRYTLDEIFVKHWFLGTNFLILVIFFYYKKDNLQFVHNNITINKLDKKENKFVLPI